MMLWCMLMQIQIFFSTASLWILRSFLAPSHVSAPFFPPHKPLCLTVSLHFVSRDLQSAFSLHRTPCDCALLYMHTYMWAHCPSCQQSSFLLWGCTVSFCSYCFGAHEHNSVKRISHQFLQLKWEPPILLLFERKPKCGVVLFLCVCVCTVSSWKWVSAKLHHCSLNACEGNR